MQSAIRSGKLLPTVLVMLLYLISVPLSSRSPEDSKSWAIIVGLNVSFPPGIKSSVKADILEPKPGDTQIKGNVTCDVQENCHFFELWGESLVANKPPSHFIFRITSPGFEPQIVNTGIISWHRDSMEWSTSQVELTVKFSGVSLPTLEHVIELGTTAPLNAQILEASVFNPASKQINLTALEAESVIATNDDVLCYATTPYTLFEVSINVDGPFVKGMLKPLSPADIFTYPLSGKVAGSCGGNASIVVTGKFDYLIEPNKRALIRLNFDNSEREAAAKRVIENGRHEFSKRIGTWQILFQVDEQFWIVADTITPR